MRVLHVTPHLGGGVGKAVSGLVLSPDGTEHVIACLERPEKTQVVDLICAAGRRVLVAPNDAELAAEMRAADVVQIEFWNHPLIPKLLCRTDLPWCRVLVWGHMSGVGAARFPPNLFPSMDHVVLTTAASLSLLDGVPADHPRVTVVSSGSVDELPPPPIRSGQVGTLRAGYVGTLNPSKLHPDFVGLLADVDIAGFQVTMVGDRVGQPELEAQCRRMGRPGLLQFTGYVTDVPRLLAEFDVLLYLLNPDHYGSAENALLEAMAMGVVPVVMDNPSERKIVEDGVTGIVVHDRASLASALRRLATDPDFRARLSTQAADSVRSRYGVAQMRAAMAKVYASVLTVARHPPPDGRAIFGPTPADWFLSFLRDRAPFVDDGRLDLPPGRTPDPALMESSKGTVFHFLRAFPQDPRLQAWARALRERE